MDVSSEKTILRRLLLHQRQAMPIEEWQRKNEQVCEQLRSQPEFIHATTVLAYFSLRQEPDLSSLFSLPKTWGFPRCINTDLSWHQWSPSTEPGKRSQISENDPHLNLPLQRNKFGILEPHPDSPLILSDAVDLILIPAVACDRQGYRLGYGGGYYDRLLSHPDWSDKPTIAIVFTAAYLPALPRDPWDRPVRSVCTETRCFSTKLGTL
jgi:5-formyltetrahydrofolate cyclo-ligase